MASPPRRLSFPNGLIAPRTTGSTDNPLGAADDASAVRAFLDLYAGSPRTLDAYTREIERFLLWHHHRSGSGLTAIRGSDIADYLAFLADPQPWAFWCGPRRRRDHPDWRPLVGPLGPAARQLARAALQSLFQFLLEGGYVAFNPVVLSRQRGRRQPVYELPVERYLETPMVQALEEAVASLPDTTPREIRAARRAEFAVAMLLTLGPRASELVNHRMGDIQTRGGRWWWQIRGKGGYQERLPVPARLLEKLVAYRQVLGLSPHPPAGDPTPLLVGAGVDDQGIPRGITRRHLLRLVKDWCERAAQHLLTSDGYPELSPAERQRLAARLRQVSTHWCRHTAISRLGASGAPFPLIRQLARHRDPRTTGRYLHSDPEALADALEEH